MKKLLVVLLTVVMILSLAAIASAEVSTWIGGDFYFRYNSLAKQWEPGANNFFVGGITAKATKDNTWAKLWINTDTWQGTAANAFNDSIKYALGIDKLGGLVSLSWSTKDLDLCNIGQATLMDSFDDFKTDPVFNTYEFANSFGLVIDSDSFAIKAETVAVNRLAADNVTILPNNFAMEGIFKFEGGKAYVAYKTNSANPWEIILGGDTLIDAGAEMKFGEMAVKADLWLPSKNQASLGTIVQGNVAMGAWDATLYVQLPPNGVGDNIIGVGGNYKLDKLTVGAKYFNTTEATMELYGLYNVGAFDIRAGYVKPGTVDGYFVLGVHAGIW